LQHDSNRERKATGRDAEDERNVEAEKTLGSEASREWLSDGEPEDACELPDNVRRHCGPRTEPRNEGDGNPRVDEERRSVCPEDEASTLATVHKRQNRIVDRLKD